MAHTRNAALAARIAELGYTERELAAMLNDAVEKTTGARSGATDRYIRLLLTGGIRWPWPATRDALEQVLGQSMRELGFVPRGKRGFATSPPPAPPVARPAMPLEIDTFGVVPIRVVLPALPPAGRCTGMSDVRRQAAVLRELTGIEHRYGSVGLADAAVAQADRLLAALPAYQVSDQVQRGWYRLAAELLTSAGWYTIDSGEPAAAGPYLRRALTLAVAAQDAVLHAHLNHVMAEHALAAADATQASACEFARR